MWILKGSNSTPLEAKLAPILLLYHLKNGLIVQMQLVSFLNREISKLNYRIHTDAIKDNLMPAKLTPYQISMTYASEADVLNVALFGITAKQWRGK